MSVSLTDFKQERAPTKPGGTNNAETLRIPAASERITRKATMNVSVRAIMAEPRPRPRQTKPKGKSAQDGLYADAAKVKSLRKRGTLMGTDSEALDGPLQEEL